MNFNKFLIIFAITLMLSELFPQSFTGKISGKITDKETKQEIPGAIIEVMGTSSFSVSNEKGEFLIEDLQPKTYTLKISAPYYVTLYRNDVVVTGIQSSKISIELKLSNYELEEVTITGNKFFDKGRDFSVSTNSLTAEEIRRAPGAAEDLNRLVQSLPGVTTATDSRNDLIVRGGSPFENFIMVEGVEVPNINHFGTQGASGGPIGMINVDFINDVNFSAGGFPVKYGDRLSSMMDVKYRDGDKEFFSGKFDLGIAGAGVILEGPIQKNKSAYLFSARKSYLDLILSSTSLTAVPDYTNFNLKATYELNEKHKLSFMGLGGIDKIKFDSFHKEDDPMLEKTDYLAWQYAAGFVHKWLISSNVFLQTSLANNLYSKDINVDSLGKKIFSNVSSDMEVILRNDLSYRISSSDLIEAGLTYKSLRNDNNIFLAAHLNSYGIFIPDFNYNRIETASKLAGYLQYSKNLFQPLTVTGGIRYDYFNALNTKGVFTPRASFSYSITDNFLFNGAYGYYFQSPPLLWLTGDPRNKELKQMKAEHIVAGVEYFPAVDIKMSLEVYQKKYNDYAASVNNPFISYANIGTEYTTSGLEYLISASSGIAKGFEFYLQKKLTNNLYGLFNYSYSTIKFKALDGIERPGSFDYRNVLTLIIGYKFNDALEVSAKYRYMGGRPITPFDLTSSSLLNRSIFDYTRFNSERLDYYQRIDLRVDYRVQFEKWAMVSFIDFENLFNRENIEQLIWNQKKNQPDKVLQWKFLPAGGVKIEF